VSVGDDGRAYGSRGAGGNDEGGGGLPAFLLDPQGVVQRRGPWMLGAGLVGLVATLVAVAVWPVRYVAQATLLVTGQQIPEDFVRSTVSEDSIGAIDALAGKVFALENLVRLIKDQQIYPELEGKASPNVLAQRMLANVEFIRVHDFSGTSRRKGNEVAMIYGVSFVSEDPQRSAQVANALASLFVEASISRRNEQARRTTEFLRRELERDERDLRENNAVIMDFRTKHRGVLPSELDANSRKLDMLSGRRQTITTDIAAREARIASLLSMPSEAAMSTNETLLEESRRQLAQQLAINTEEHPNVIAVRDRVARLEALVRRERTVGRQPSIQVRRLIDGERQQISIQQAQLEQIDAGIAEISGRVEQTPRTAESLASIEERGMVLREDYISTLRKVEEAELAENLESAQQGSQVSLLDPAAPPQTPEVSRWVVLLGGVVGSLGVALLIAFLLELVDPVLLSARQLEDIAELPVLGSLPRIV
jgi:uncharacterized protein involved in exopolysaccharide biosynthesis